MGKELLKWMAAGAGAILLAVLDAWRSGNVSLKALGGIILGAIAYRVGSFLVAYFGPKPVV